VRSLDHFFDREVRRYSLLPHAPLCGRAVKFNARYPQGRNQVLLSIPKCDFGCQALYVLNPPKLNCASTRWTGTQTGTNQRPGFASGDNRSSVLRYTGATLLQDRR
jgi:hypothetical protein